MRFEPGHGPVHRRQSFVRAVASDCTLHRFTRNRQIARAHHAARALHTMGDAHASRKVLQGHRRAKSSKIGSGLGHEIQQDLRSVGGSCSNLIQFHKIDGRVLQRARFRLHSAVWPGGRGEWQPLGQGLLQCRQAGRLGQNIVHLRGVT